MSACQGKTTRFGTEAALVPRPSPAERYQGVMASYFNTLMVCTRKSKIQDLSDYMRENINTVLLQHHSCPLNMHMPYTSPRSGCDHGRTEPNGAHACNNLSTLPHLSFLAANAVCRVCHRLTSSSLSLWGRAHPALHLRSQQCISRSLLHPSTLAGCHASSQPPPHLPPLHTPPAMGGVCRGCPGRHLAMQWGQMLPAVSCCPCTPIPSNPWAECPGRHPPQCPGPCRLMHTLTAADDLKSHRASGGAK